MTEGADARESVITRVFDAPREQVWMEPEQSSRWWGPRGWSKPLSEITMDVRPGGAFRLISVPDEDGTEMVQEGTSPTRGSSSSPASRTRKEAPSTPPRWGCPRASRTR